MPQNFKNITATTLYTIKGNDSETNALARIAEAQVKRIIIDNEDMLGLRADMTAASIIQAGYAGTLIYRLPKKNVMGTDYDPNEGIQRQRTASLDTAVKMDQHITGELMLEQFDTTRLREMPEGAAGDAARAGLVDQWISAFMESYLMGIEAVFIRGVMDSTIAYENKRPGHVLHVDPKEITDAQSAQAFYMQIGQIVNGLRKMVSDTAMGMNKSRVKIAMSSDLYLALMLHLPNFILNDATFRVFSQGKLASDSILGTPVTEHLMLANKFEAGEASQINKDLSFDFSHLHLIMYIDDAMVMPIGMEQSEMIKDNKTLNPKWISKNMGSLPVDLRPEYIFIGLDKAISQDDIKKAQAQVYDGVSTDYTKSFQQADWDRDFGTAPASDNSGVTLANATTADGTTIKLDATTKLAVAAKNSDFTLTGTDAKIKSVDGAANATTVSIVLSKAIAKSDSVSITAKGYANKDAIAVDTTGMAE